MVGKNKEKSITSMTMHEIVPLSKWKSLICIMFFSSTILLTVSYYDYAKMLTYQVLLTTNVTKEIIYGGSNNTEEEENYLISSSKCKILDIDPFSNDAKKYFKPQKYKSCSRNDLLTYVTKEDNIATVHIDSNVISQYTVSDISCCYSNVSRKTTPVHPDNSISLSDCKDFQDNVTIFSDAIFITCTEKGSKKKIYENVHNSVRITPQVREKMKMFDNNKTKPISVLFVGIDSISRLNFIRALPNTYRYVEDNGWMSLKGYNKIDDNTFPNLMAILTGFNQTTAYSTCNPKAIGFLDKCPMMWYKFRDLGYITGYAEDEATISTFNYNKKGFTNPPVDYYFRPYTIATEKLSKVYVSSMKYCTGPETSGERILNVAKDFAVTFKEYPHFGFFWMNTFSHNEISTPNMMDNKLRAFLSDLDSSGVTNNSLVIFLSDHGIRFGDIRLTETGWLEERLPFIYFSFPPWFQERFPREYANFKKNVDRLTTPYDVHMTLQHILKMSDLNHTITPSDACPKCLSLFEEVPEERSCEDAKISQHWCTCAGYSKAKLDATVEQKLSSFFLGVLNKIVSNRWKLGGDKCAKFTGDHISVRLSHKFSYKSTSYALVTLTTHPRAIFETTIRFNDDIMNSTLIAGDISRLDYYSAHSTCVSDAYLKKYCYCK